MNQKTSKFEGVTFSPEKVELWTPELISGQGFRCQRGEFVTYWKPGRIAREVKSHLCRCWILRYEETLAGYITLLADKLTVQSQLLATEQVQYRTFPAVKMGLLATDKRAKGAGSCLVEWAMEYVVQTLSPAIGVRFLTVDALYDPDTGYDSSGFYQKFGFRWVNPDESLPPLHGYRTMYFDLKPLIDSWFAIIESSDDLEKKEAPI